MSSVEGGVTHATLFLKPRIMRRRVILLKENSPEIRQKIRDAGIMVCACAEFPDADWLNLYPDIGSVHGCGFPYEGMTKEQTRAYLESDWKKYNIVVVTCSDVDEFIQTIKSYLK